MRFSSFVLSASRRSCSREVGSSDFGDRVVKRFGSIPESKSTDANHIGSLAAQDGPGAKGEMGEGSEGIAASSGDSQNNGFGSCEAHHVSIRP